MNITELLTFSHKQNASDLHLASNLSPMIRIDGDIKKINFPPINDSSLRKMLLSTMDDIRKEEFARNLQVDFSFEVPNVSRFRANVFKQSQGISGAFRTIPRKILSMEDLGMGEIFKKISSYPRGLVLVTGPTGSGKSTTLAAMLDYINHTKSDHILTIEDPIEFVYQSKKCLVSQREVHRDTHSFSDALKSSLREDPDIILVGEMRDLETIRLALTAAETGHLVFGTLHTTSASKTIDRIIDVFPAEEKYMIRSMLSGSLQAVIAQTLIKKKNGGRIAAHEIMLGTTGIRNLIRENKVAQMYSTIQTGNSVGMKTLEQSLKNLISGGIISVNNAKEKSSHPDQFN